MTQFPRLLSAPPPHPDEEAHSLFTAQRSPAGEHVRLLACPAPSEGPQRYRMPLWRFFGKLK